MQPPTDRATRLDQLVQLAEFKRIAASVENALTDVHSKRLVVTSPFANEGKTMLAAGLAIQAATTYNLRVLAVDLHWRSPRLHACFNLQPNIEGHQAQDAESALQFVQKTQTDGLDLLAAPQEADNGQFREGVKLSLDILDKAKALYDRIVVDTGSLFPANRFMLDPMNFARNADGTVMVILGGVTPRDTAKRASQMFKNAGGRLIGMIMNQWKNPMYTA